MEAQIYDMGTGNANTGGRTCSGTCTCDGTRTCKNLVKEEVEEKTRETARKMLSKNIPEDVVAECTGLKLSDVNKLLKG